MSPSELADICAQIQEYSLIERYDPGDSVQFKDVLLKLASILRQNDFEYYIEYHRPDQPVFRLRSDTSPDPSWHTERLSLLEPGHELVLRVSDLTTAVFEGICSELRLLGEASWDEDERIREPELNLLTRRPFRAELFAEFQRWERYETPFLVVVIQLTSEQSWEKAARELKHLGKSWYEFGFLDEQRVAAMLRCRTKTDSVVEKLTSRLNLRFPDETVEVNIREVPSDVTDWHSLQEWVFHPDPMKESDQVGHKTT